MYTTRHVHNSACAQLGMYGMYTTQRVHNSACTQLGVYTTQHVHNAACTQLGVYTTQHVHNSACTQLSMCTSQYPQEPFPKLSVNRILCRPLQTIALPQKEKKKHLPYIAVATRETDTLPSGLYFNVHIPSTTR